MTTAVAGPVTAPRPRRGAAGRRALQVVLFLGGLLALGLLFGARAQADQQPDGQPDRQPGGHAVQQLLQRPFQEHPEQQEHAELPEQQEQSEQQGQREQQPVRTATDTAADGATLGVARKAAASPASPASSAPAPPAPRDAARVALTPGTEPARTTVRQVTRRAAEVAEAGGTGGETGETGKLREVVDKTVGAAVTGLRDITVALPAPGAWPLPVPSSPAAPEAPQSGPARVSDVPGSGAPDLPAAPRPVTTPAAPGHPGPAAFSVPREAAEAAYGEAAADHRPAPRKPFGPDGGQGHSASAEAHPPRGGDQHAVPLADGTSFGLVRGAGLPATAAPVRDRSGDILEFPG
ncbi:hypothetical protein ACGFZA_01800 [Streptomyces sp. NPDC048211]|uniref:hypothetical protein n=1 Tax=Streptomyces sp. NPDC048211 TaxID=3365516 RepID=UPI003717ACB9